MRSETSYHPLIARIGRLWRGCSSMLGTAVFPLGRLTGPLLRHLRTPDRLDRGLVLVLPGIEGESGINHGIVRGLADGGVKTAIEIFDWTTGLFLLSPYHLRSWRRNIAQAQRLACRIAEYRRAYPGRPVYLVGHSGGAALSLPTIERLPPDVKVTGAVLLQPAISPGYDLSAALAKTELGIWSFDSRFDLFFLGLMTCILGTVDGRYGPAAGLTGFRRPPQLSAEGQRLYDTRLHQTPFRWRMCMPSTLAGTWAQLTACLLQSTIAPLLRGTQ